MTPLQLNNEFCTENKTLNFAYHLFYSVYPRPTILDLPATYFLVFALSKKHSKAHEVDRMCAW